MRIKKGDKIIVIAGKDRGKHGSVDRVFPKKETVLIGGVNQKKRHTKARTQGGSGSIVEVAAPIHISNVQLLDASAKRGVRVGYTTEKGKKVRISKVSGKAI